MSGFAALNGEPDGPPLLPPLALADGVTAFAAAFAILAALRAREPTGRGQVVDLSLIEPLMTLLGPQLAQLRPARRAAAAHRQPVEPQRAAQRLPHRRRPLGRGVRERDEHRRARAAPRRARRPRRRRRGSRPAPAAPRTSTRSTTRSRPGSPRAPRDEVIDAFERARPPSRRSTTPATSSRTRSCRRSARSPTCRTRSSGAC